MVRPLAPIDLVIAGPTASGKSRLALEWARLFGAEIVSADSRQIYREIGIGTGKATGEERAAIPHHLLDGCSVTQAYSAGEFVRDAREAIREIQERGRRVVVCGGTGLYLKALLSGIVALPTGEGPLSRQDGRKMYEEVPTTDLWDRLRHVDPDRAASIHPNDRVRLLRALSLLDEYGLPPTRLYERYRGEGIPALRIVGLDSGRTTLYREIADRVGRMMRNGWVGEVQDLLRMGVPSAAPGFNSLGYRDILDCIEGRAAWEVLEETVVRKTRQYAKRQITWFRHMEGLSWIDPARVDPVSLEPVSTYGNIRGILHRGG